MLHDAHLHIKDPMIIEQMKQFDIAGIANVSDPKEYHFIRNLQKSWNKLYYSVGIHPWKADQTNYEEMVPLLSESKIIGEIGLDNVWCNCDLKIQTELFEKQLRLAYQAQKPVILHTKGMEKEVLDLIKKYPNRYLVHWYSSSDYLEDYIEIGCYFTVGVSVKKDEAVNQVAKKVDIHHLLLESDGIDAISWADETCCKIDEYASILERSIDRIAQIRGIPPQLLKKQLNENFQTFLEE